MRKSRSTEIHMWRKVPNVEDWGIHSTRSSCLGLSFVSPRFWKRGEKELTFVQTAASAKLAGHYRSLQPAPMVAASPKTTFMQGAAKALLRARMASRKRTFNTAQRALKMLLCFKVLGAQIVTFAKFS